MLVPYDETTFEQLCEQIRSEGDRRPGWLRKWIAAARPLTVTIPTRKLDGPIRPLLEEVHFARNHNDQQRPDWFLALPGLVYDGMLGLIEPDQQPNIL